MALLELVRDLPIGSLAGGQPGAATPVLVRRVCYDSRRAAPGDLFVAWRGQHADGRRFAPQAIERGAVAVLADGPPLTDPATVATVPWLESERPRALLLTLQARLCGHPERALGLIGITGTNGKSSTAWLVEAVLREAGLAPAVLGTLGYRYGDTELPGERTTPEGSDLVETLAAVRALGARSVAMEVSSHALEQGRVFGLRFAVAVFTNLTRDHFDLHRDWDGYFQAKRRLFDQLAPGGVAVINRDDSWGRRLINELRARGVRVIEYGAAGQVSARSATLHADGIEAEVQTPRGVIELRSPLIGRYNLENLLAAVAVGEAMAIDHQAVRRATSSRAPIPGRLEPVWAGQPFPMLVDYAHTDAGLRAALLAVREATGRRIALVFGCGGDRDPGKRPLMGKVAGELADLAIATSDNPRTEDPLRILAAVEEGLVLAGATRYRVIADRRTAIRAAVAVARAEPGWCVLIAGKGHEQEQIVGAEARPFSDRLELRLAVEEEA